MKNKAKECNGLTSKQRAFVAAYLSNGFNATKAAVKAGYAADERCPYEEGPAVEPASWFQNSVSGSELRLSIRAPVSRRFAHP